MKMSCHTKYTSAIVALGTALMFGCESSQHSAYRPSVPVTTVIHAPAPQPVAQESIASSEAEVPTELQILARPPQSISPGVQEVAKLIRSGVGLDVLLDYIHNSPREYELSADEIIYLRDIGASDEILQSMMSKSDSFEHQALLMADAESIELSHTPVMQDAPVDQLGEVPSNSEANVVEGSAPGVAYGPPQMEPSPSAVADPYPVVVPSENAQPTVIVESAPAAQEPAVVNNYYFYETLEPYGNWVEVSDYGWCWQPSVSVVQYDWRPYHTQGRWLYTNQGWYWKSYYSWGYVPFHYGRWHNHNRHGWVWVPGSTWGPAWVTWRHHQNYVGWAPLPPEAYYDHGLGFRFGGRYVGNDFGFSIGFGYYSFVDHGHFYHDHPGRYHVPYNNHKEIYENSRVNNNYVRGDNNTIINGGVNITTIQGAGRREIEKLVIRDSNPTANRVIQPERFDNASRSLAVYRPNVTQHSQRPPERIVSQSRVEQRKVMVGGSETERSTIQSRTRTESPATSPAIARSSASDSRAPISRSNSIGNTRSVTPANAGNAGRSTTSRLETVKRSSPSEVRSQTTTPAPSSTTRSTIQRSPSSSSRISTRPSQTTTRSNPIVVPSTSSRTRTYNPSSSTYTPSQPSSSRSTAGRISGQPTIVRQSPSPSSNSSIQFNSRSESQKVVIPSTSSPRTRSVTVPSTSSFGNNSNRRSMPSVSPSPSPSRSRSSVRPSTSDSSGRSRVTSSAPSSSRTQVGPSSSSSSSGRSRVTSSSTSTGGRTRVGSRE